MSPVANSQKEYFHVIAFPLPPSLVIYLHFARALKRYPSPHFSNNNYFVEIFLYCTVNNGVIPELTI